MRPVASWGRLNAHPHHLVNIRDSAQVKCLISSGPHPGLAHGMGRSYGDACLNPNGTLWLTAGLDHFIAFAADNGRLICESGVILGDIQRLVIPQGWILPVTPGTQLVTVGGAIANDVHGKNHHCLGSFGDHVRRIKLIRTNGETIECGPQLESKWFEATIGGLGLTGVIVEVEIQLRRVAGPWIDTETIPYANLEEFFRLADDSEAGWEYTVSWIDCISNSEGRGLFIRGNSTHTKPRPKPKMRKLSVPIVPPLSLVNRLSLRPFNLAYYHLGK